MASQNSFFTSSPTVVLPPQPDQYFASSHYANSIGNGASPGAASNPYTPIGSIPPTPGSLAGRKRSRGDIHAPEEEEGFDDGSSQASISATIPIPRGKPVYGPGMTLIYPEDPGYEAAAESQSGTWIEERATRNQFQLSHTKRPSFSTRKSQRRNADAAGPDDLAQLVLPPQMREATVEPLIDEATRLLGISWTRMDSTEALRINQAAYSKWIQKHYPGLKEVTLWFENSAIPGYLVAAQNAYNGQQEFFIFAEDLTEARLVTSDPAQLVPRLKMLPALHLAAPGGCIRAEKELTVVPSCEEGFSRPQTATDDGGSASWPSYAMCSAHEMDTD